jgi:DNA modification methylase
MINLYQGDCLNELKKLPDNSVDSLVTDPPAGISFMGKEWDSNKGGRDGWIKWMSEVMTECKRVMKPGAHGLVWAIPRTSHWTATALEDAGFEVRDVITHLFGSGFPKSMDISKAIDKAAGAEREVLATVKKTPSYKNSDTNTDSSNWDYGSSRLTYEAPITAPATNEAKQWQGWGTALKPASEHWILVRKPLDEKTVAANVLKHGTGGINIDVSRIDLKDGETTHGSGAVMRGGATYSLDGSGFDHDNERKGVPNIKSTQGRFPANLVLSHSPHCHDDQCDIECAIKALDEQSGILKSGGHAVGSIVNANHKNSAMAGKLKPFSIDREIAPNAGGASRFFYCAKISSSERNAGLDGMPDVIQDVGKLGINKAESREVRGRSVNPTIVKNHHPTVKPKKLMSYFIRMITPPDGIVLDPFMGSGSTGLAARETGFKFIGIEKEPEYFEIASKRING